MMLFSYMGTYSVSHISVSINCDPDRVYKFVYDPMNLPKWASGLSNGTVGIVADGCMVDSPMGKVKLEFEKSNSLGVLDHFVTLESGQRFYNPMRVIPNGSGSLVTFILFHLENMTPQQFEEDAKTIEKDLQKLKELLEKN